MTYGFAAPATIGVVAQFGDTTPDFVTQAARRRMGFPGGEGTSNKATLEVAETFATDRTNPESFVPLLNAPHLFHEMANDGVPIV